MKQLLIVRRACSLTTVWLATLLVGAAAYSENGAPSQSEWPILGGSSDQAQYSAVDLINDKNVGKLGLAWAADLPVRDGLVGNPLVRDGVVYQGAPGGRILANDLRTGKLLWVFDPAPLDRSNYSFVALWGTHFNRGVAIDDKHAYIASGDCRLFAVDRNSGKLIWEAPACDPTKDYATISAPRIGRGKVFVGNTNMEFGTERGYVEAFDAATGRQLWRFYTIPGDPAKGFENATMEMAAKTWGTDYWKYVKGGAGPWDSMTYDEKLDQLYVGVGNPVPITPDLRAPDAGEELFAGAIVALDASTGDYVWHYKTILHDGWDKEAAAHMVIAELPIAGSTRRVVMQASKNGFYYVLDAVSGRLLSANNFVPNNWASHVDMTTGRLIIRPEGQFWKYPDRDVIMEPGIAAHAWTLMSYNPKTGLTYIPAVISPRCAWAVKPSKDQQGEDNVIPGMSRDDFYCGMKPGAKIKAMGKLIAWDPIQQRERWHADQIMPYNGGVLSTAGNLVFQATGDGMLNAYAADTGKHLWKFDIRGVTLAAATSVTIDGEQLILIPTGDAGATGMSQVMPQVIVANPMTQPRSRLLAFKLGGNATLPPAPSKVIPKPFRPLQPEALAKRGAQLFTANGCYTCHGYELQKFGAGIPDLRMTARETFDVMESIVIKGAFRQLGMPAFPKLTQVDLEAIQAYITNQAWAAYEQQQNP